MDEHAPIPTESSNGRFSPPFEGGGELTRPINLTLIDALFLMRELLVGSSPRDATQTTEMTVWSRRLDPTYERGIHGQHPEE